MILNLLKTYLVVEEIYHQKLYDTKKETYIHHVTYTDGSKSKKALGRFYLTNDMKDKTKRERVEAKIDQYFTNLRDILDARQSDLVSFIKLINYLIR